MQITELQCKGCKEIKSLSEFDRSFFGKKGFDVYCHDCRLEVKKIENEVLEKRCRQCGRIKSVSEFGKNASSHDGYFKECFDCQEENHRRRRARRNEGAWDGKTSVCRICGLQKPTYEFISTWNKRIGYVYCRSCIAEMIRKKLLRYEHERELHGWPIKKRCKKCGRILPSDKFNLDRRIRDGLADLCIECKKQWYNQRLENLKEKHRIKKFKKDRLKECSICHKLKMQSNFTKDASSIDGYSDMCILCSKKVRQDYTRIWTHQREEKKVVFKEMQCRMCGRILPIEMFSKNIDIKKGYYTFCKDCHKQNVKEAEERWESERKKVSFEFSLNTKVEKKCKLCGQILSLSNFYKRHASKDGHNHYCKICISKKEKERNKRLKERGFPEELIPEEKLCNKCNRVLPRSMFSKNSISSDGLNNRCKDCYKKYYKEYYHHPEVKEKKKLYNHLPEVMERRRKYAKLYSHKPEVKKREKEYKKEYLKRPYVKEKRKKFNEEYYQRPEVRERRKEYYKRPEVREHRRKKQQELRLKKRNP